MTGRARDASRVRQLVLGLGLPLAAVLMATGCATTADPAAKPIREKASHAEVGLDARLTPLMRQHKVIVDWQADYCVDDPLTVADWECYATRNVALQVPDLRAGAEAVDVELRRLGCHPLGDPTRMGLVVMLDHQAEQNPPHRLPPVEFRCGEDAVHVQPSDSTDERHLIVQRPTAWPQQATGGADSRLLSGGVIAPQDSARLRGSDEPLLLITAVRPYHSQ